MCDMIALAEGVRNLAREGSLRMIVSDAFLRCAAEEGLRVREYAPSPGGSVRCTVRAEDDILIGRLAANLSGAIRVDLCICDERGVEQFRLSDIPVHCGANSIAYQGCDQPVAARPPESPRDGRERRPALSGRGRRDCGGISNAGGE